MPAELTVLNDAEFAEFLRAIDTSARCASCRFWQEHGSPSWASTVVQLVKLSQRMPLIPHAVDHPGSCKRHAPSVDPNDPNEINWPITRWDDWCGDHAAASR